MATRSTRPTIRAALVASVFVLASCGDGGVKGSATCEDAPPGGARLRSAAPDGGEPTTPEEEVDGSRLVYCADLADPFVLRVDRAIGERDYVFGTQTDDKNLPVLITRGVLRRESIEDALPALPAWAADGGSWAPAALQRDDAFVLYYTTTDKASGRQCISLAVADEPQGPYADTSTAPLVCPVDQGGAIDPSPFVDADGSAWLYWKNDGNCCGAPTRLYAQPLAPDGRSLTGPATEVLRADQPWEGGVVEAPSMARIEDRLFLFYSGNAWSTAAYAIGYAICESPTGPCTKPLDHPWLGSSETAAGPGGAEVYVDGDGGAHLIFHAWDASKVGYAAGGYRQVVTSKLAVVDGVPVTQK